MSYVAFEPTRGDCRGFANLAGMRPSANGSCPPLTLKEIAPRRPPETVRAGDRGAWHPWWRNADGVNDSGMTMARASSGQAWVSNNPPRPKGRGELTIAAGESATVPAGLTELLAEGAGARLADRTVGV